MPEQHHDHDKPMADPVDLVNVGRLPPVLRRLCWVLGNKAAFELCRVRGGVPLTVPKVFAADHPLVQIIGVQCLVKLIDDLGGQLVDVPKYDKVAQQLRHQGVHAHLKAGLGLTRTALATGYTKRHVLNIQTDLAEAEGRIYTQPDLFGDVDQDIEHDAPDQAVAQADRQPVTKVDDEHREVALSSNLPAHNPFGMFKPSR